uniref:ATP synthase complex subunit 8 n=1 Tax=Laevipilina antarctica TaxID=358449 RepID=A0A1L6BZY5_9MOLL|nr:ATP synthase F0 subunit 8 [Laevipilina antarctica]APQ42965.1 ATP synthase F0 subunit 8 [Laevipilina antarctica]
MPQLSPLSWLFLFVLFWAVVFLVLSLLWWESNQDLSVGLISENKKFKPSESVWYWN